MVTRSDLVRGGVLVLVFAGAVFAGTAEVAAAPIDLDGSFRMNVEASETEVLGLTDLVATVAVFGAAWRTTGRLTLADNEIVAFDVTDERSFGPFLLRTICVFDPEIGFSYLGSAARFAVADVQMGNYVFLSSNPSLSYNQLTAKWTADGPSLTGVCRVGVCPIEFRNAQVAGQWYVPNCDLFMDVRGEFTDVEGFDYLRVTGRFPRVPFLSNGVIETELRMTVHFETDRKSFTPSLRMRAGKVNACMTPYVQLVSGGSPVEIDGLEVYGWTVECSVADSVELLLALSLDPARNRELTGEADFWEAWKLRGAVPGCCGRDLAWELVVYFEEGGDPPFDWGRTITSVEIPLGERLTARFGTEFGATSPHWVLDAGLELRF